MTRRAVAIGVLAVWVPAWVAAQAVPQGTEFQINTYTQDDQIFPSLCSDAAGNFVVVWSSYGPQSGQDGDRAGVFGRRYASAGTPVGPEFQVNTYTIGDQAFGVVACDAAGGFVVVWSSYLQDGDSYGVFGQRFSSSGAPAGTEFAVNAYTSSAQDFAAAASDAAGNFVVVWSGFDQDGADFGVFGRRYASDGAPLGSEFQVNTWFTGRQSRAVVSAIPSGPFVVSWTSYDQDGDEGGVFAQRFDADAARLGTEFQVNSLTEARQYLPAISSANDGAFVIVWESATGDGYDRGILAQRFASNGAFAGTEFVANSYTSGTQYAPSVAMDPAGTFVVTWTTYEYAAPDGDLTGVFARSFDSTGEPMVREFQVNTFTAFYQNYPVVVAQATGKFVIVWQSYDQDGYGFGIFGRRYTTSVLLGDCNRDGRVTTNELVVAIYIDLGQFPLGDCEAIDGDMSLTVTIDEIVGAIANAMAG